MTSLIHDMRMEEEGPIQSPDVVNLTQDVN